MHMSPQVSLVLFLSSMSCVSIASDAQFGSVPAAVDEADKQRVITTSNFNFDGKNVPVGYKLLLRSGDRIPLLGRRTKQEYVTFGALIDNINTPILADDNQPRVSNYPDFNSLLNLGYKGLWMVSQFESFPAVTYLTQMRQNKKTGELVPLSSHAIDFSAVHGGWAHCAGSVSPWQTHLAGEEYEPNARLVNPDTGKLTLTDGKDGKSYTAMANYFNGDMKKINPYYYGWPIEIEVLNAKGDTRVNKHYAMGRVSLELPYVMPDERTVYFTDDGTNVGLYLFIADKARDLSAGNLYAARWNQTNKTSADISWVALGHALSKDIRTSVDKKLKFTDIFKVAEPVDDQCPKDFQSINSGHSSPFHECLRLKPGMEQLASRLETRRYAALMGATTEWRKMEGITYDATRNNLYLSISEVSHGMEDKPQSEYDIGGPNHIKLAKNACGAVLKLALGKNKNMDSNFVVTSMAPLLAGKAVKGDENNNCALDGLANPDNLTYMSGYDQLIIGEDSGSGHQNDMLWAYDIDKKSLTRLQTTPYGAEVTSVYWYPDINGWGYLMNVIQHPYGESDQDKYQIGSMSDRAYVGYIGPFLAP